jgi:hypothetical protein
MKAFGFVWAGGLLGCCSLSTQAFAQSSAAVTVMDISGQQVQDVAFYYDTNGNMQKVEGTDGTVYLHDLGEKVTFRIENPVYGNHDVSVQLSSNGKYEVNLVFAGGDLLAKVRPFLSDDRAPLSGLKGAVATGVDGGDTCGTAAAIAGSGSFAFDSTGSGTDGVDHTGFGACTFYGLGNNFNDIWYAWTADCDGNAIIDTCSTALDTKLNVYNGTASCPPGNGDIIVCNDDFCAFQSQVLFPATNGTTYLIRVGGFDASVEGPGTLDVVCQGGGGGGGCTSATFCQTPDLATGYTSNDVGSIFTVADNFSATAAGNVTDVCWWGVGFDGFGDCSAFMTDNFTITYYNDDGNGACPGSLKAGPFNVIGSRTATGNLILGVFIELQWEASHAPVPVNAGECTWIEIKNADGGCFFAWETGDGGDGRACQTDVTLGTGVDPGDDMAWCLNLDFDNTNCDITAATNNLCANATPIAGQGTFAYDNTGATTDGPVHNPVCSFFGGENPPGQTTNDLWWCWTSDCTGDVRWETCGLTGSDTKLNLYSTCVCPPTTLLACNDDDCGLQSGITFAATAGTSYLLRVGNFPGAAAGPAAFSLTCVAVPANDDCVDAIALAIPSTTNGSNQFSTVDGTPFCGTTVDGPGVWYTVTGTGNTITANTCQNPSLDTKLHVYCGSCANPAALTCVTGNDDFCSFQSQVTWCSQSGATYRIMVSGFGGATGNFTLDLSDNGVQCSGAISCVTTGACCIGVDFEQCVEVTSADCAAIGGVYQGDDVACGGYNASACANPFQDITATGTQLVLGDDQGIVVGLFNFDFFGVTKTSVAVCSNGYLTFGATTTDFTEDPIPSPATPNDLIAPLWDDFNPGAGGTVHHQTTGPVGNRVFIAQWTNVPHFSSGGQHTFQALLFEIDDHIEFRYGNLSVSNGSVGIEDASGTTGTAWTSGVGAGDCVQFVLSLACPPPECHLVFAQSTGNDTFNANGHTWNTQLDNVYAFYPVWLDDMPTFQIPPFTNFPIRWANIRNLMMMDVPFQQYSVQVVMWNPEVFPGNPEQYTDVLNVTVWLSGNVQVTRTGSVDHMGIDYEVFSQDGYNYLRFPFTIDGF